MNIIICGAGKVGYSISQQLSAQGHSITVIDDSSDEIKRINETQDVKGIVGKATYPAVEILLLPMSKDLSDSIKDHGAKAVRDRLVPLINKKVNGN